MNDEELDILIANAEYESQPLKDYITNLQQENQELNDSIIWWNNRFNAVQRENERLKDQNNDLRKIYRNTYNKLFENGNDELARYFQAQIDECRTFYVEPIIDYYKEWLDYKSRIDKAVEYIEHSKFIKEQVIMRSNYNMQDFQIRELLNILRGKDNE